MKPQRSELPHFKGEIHEIKSISLMQPLMFERKCKESNEGAYPEVTPLYHVGSIMSFLFSADSRLSKGPAENAGCFYKLFPLDL